MLKLKETKIRKLIAKTINFLQLIGRRESTISRYKSALSFFFSNCNYKGNLKKFSEDDLLDYIQINFIVKGKQFNTYNVHIAAIKKMFLVNYKKKFISELLPKRKETKRLPVIIPKDTFIQIFNNEKNIKHKCWLILSYCSGLRASEVATLKIENINSKEHYLIIIGKGDKERKTVLPDIVIKLLRIYYVQSGMTKKTGYLFEGNGTNEHISPQTVSSYFSSLKDIDERYTYHSLRHSFATYFLMNDGNIYDLQQMLGHKHISTTMIYLHTSIDFNNMKGIKNGK